MNTDPCGYCLIINMTENREGTAKDANDLKVLFEERHFAVKEYQDLTKEQIIDLMKKVRESEDLWKMKCFVMFILAHGNTAKKNEEVEKGAAYFITNQGEKIAVSTIKDSIESTKSLFGKPKLLFVQSCRGSTVDTGVKKADADDEKVPRGSDFLISFATLKSRIAVRNEEAGANFIQQIIATFKNDHYVRRYDVVSLMTIVTGEIAKLSEKVEVKGETWDKVKQNPETTFTFRKFLYFRI